MIARKPRPLASSFAWGWYSPSGWLLAAARTRRQVRLMAVRSTGRDWPALAIDGNRSVRVIVDPTPFARQQPEKVRRGR